MTPERIATLRHYAIDCAANEMHPSLRPAELLALLDVFEAARAWREVDEELVDGLPFLDALADAVDALK